MDLSDQQFTLDDARIAGDLQHATRAQLQYLRPLSSHAPHVVRSNRGRPATYSHNAILKMALMYKLFRLGLSIEVAERFVLQVNRAVKVRVKGVRRGWTEDLTDLAEVSMSHVGNPVWLFLKIDRGTATEDRPQRLASPTIRDMEILRQSDAFEGTNVADLLTWLADGWWVVNLTEFVCGVNERLAERVAARGMPTTESSA